MASCCMSSLMSAFLITALRSDIVETANNKVMTMTDSESMAIVENLDLDATGQVMAMIHQF